MPYCTNCGAQKHLMTKFCRFCGEQGIDNKTAASLRMEADQVKLQNGKMNGNTEQKETINTMDALEKLRQQLDEEARRKSSQQ